MTDTIDKTLKSVLEAATSVSVYAIRKPLKKTLPVVVYQRVTNVPQATHSGSSGFVRIRYQVTVIAKTYSSLRTLTDAIEVALLANTTDFSVSLPLEGQDEDKDENASIYTSIRDYFVWVKE